MTVGDYDLRGLDFETYLVGPVKSCSACKKVKPRADFSRHSGRSDGLCGQCKVCVSKYKEAYYRDNKAAIAEKNAEYWAKNRGFLLERGRAQRAENRERYNASVRASRRTVDGWARDRLKKCRDADRARGIESNLTVEYLIGLLEATGFVCPALGTPMSLTDQSVGNTPSVDAIIPALGHVIGNVAVISDRANRIKRDASISEVVALAAWMKSVSREA